MADPSTVETSTPSAPRPITPIGILAAGLESLVGRLNVIWTETGVESLIRDELRRLTELAGGLDDYLEYHSSRESPGLQALADRTRRHDWSAHEGVDGVATPEQEMLSGHVEGQLLKMLAYALGARRVLEIGTFTGYAALALAEGLPKGGTVVGCEIDPVVAAIAQRGFDASTAGSRIDLRVGPALLTLANLSAERKPFDLVFIDADKANYGAYLDAVLDGGLLARGGLICVDNTLMQGQPWTTGERSSPTTRNGAAIADFNDKVTTDERLEQVLIPLRDGLTVIRRSGRPDCAERAGCGGRADAG